jgi:hypothetical protein
MRYALKNAVTTSIYDGDLEYNKTSYVRCVKPNNVLKPAIFEG